MFFYADNLEETRRIRRIWAPPSGNLSSPNWRVPSISTISNTDQLSIISENPGTFLYDHSRDFNPFDDISGEVVDSWLSSDLFIANNMNPPSTARLNPYPSSPPLPLRGSTGAGFQEGRFQTYSSTSTPTVVYPHRLNHLSSSPTSSHIATTNILTEFNSLRLESPSSDEGEMSRYRWLTDSIGFFRSNPFYILECQMQDKYLIIKLENIPWSVTVNQIKREFDRYIQPTKEKLEHNVHILMDTSNGKTTNKAFMQVVHCDYNIHLLQQETNNHVIQCRRIKCSASSDDEFLSVLYPEWPGEFKDGVPLFPTNGKDPIFISQKELQNLGNICKLYKLNFNRRSHERPFFYMMSLVLNLPWHQKRAITISQRDIIYESYKLISKYLYEHSTKQHSPFDAKFIKSFVRVPLLCCGFTPKQRRIILREAKESCPHELRYTIEDMVMPHLQ